MLGNRNMESMEKLLMIVSYIDLRDGASREDIAKFIKEKVEPGREDIKVLVVSRQVKFARDAYRMVISVSPAGGFRIRKWGMLDKETFRAEMAKSHPDIAEYVKQELG